MYIKDALTEYVPVNEQEEKDREMMLSFMENNPDYLLRSNKIGHFSASAWIVNEKRDKVLFCYHKIYNSWSWVGGHADGEEDLRKVAVREANEETGITPVEFFPDIISVETLQVEGHEKRGEYVSSHLHFNLTYMMTADENAPLRIKEDENTGVRWFPLEDIKKISSEPWMIRRIYSKLIARTVV